MVLVLLAGLVSFSFLAWLVHTGHTLSFDNAVLNYIHEHASGAAELLFSFVTNLGDPLFMVPLGLIITAILLHRQNYVKAIVVAALLAGSGLMTSVFKTIFDRARPDLWQHVTVESTFSFPSGHATASFMIALALLYVCWQRRTVRRVLLYILPIYVLLISFSRLYLGVHYPTDIIGGWLVAIIWFFIVMLAVKLARPRIVNNLR